MQRITVLSVILVVVVPGAAQDFTPPPPKTPDADTLMRIKDQTAKLKEAIAEASKKVPKHEADLAVYVKAAEWIQKHNEWFTADSGKQTLAVIDEGFKRAAAAKDGKLPWLEPVGRVGRGYRSRIDGSVQPYGVVYPADYGKEPARKLRLDVHLHGRDSSLTEVKHLYQHLPKPASKEQDYVQINVYGRGNNAYRWAGEQDVFEALADFEATERVLGRGGLLDDRRRVLKGFSMGGAGTWHIGLRHPDRFAVLQPGAGFTTTHGYIARLPDPLPPHEEACLRIYDAYRYAENAFNVPIVAYSGELDKQRQAAVNIENELKKLELSNRMTHLIGPGLEHRFPPEWQQKADEVIRQRLESGGREKYPERVRFVTYSLHTSTCDWVKVYALDRQYEQAKVDASWDGSTIRASTTNVRRMVLSSPPGKLFPKTITIDGAEVAAKTAEANSCMFEKVNGIWKAVPLLRDRIPTEKYPDFQGPIDDAFTKPFVCVVGTGAPLHPDMHRSAVAQLERFRREWDKYMRGELPVKKDSEVNVFTETRDLVLFGDPRSNRAISVVEFAMSGRQGRTLFPFRWSANTLQVGEKKYDPATHLLILIHPSPFAKDRYVVLNSGHTFHEADFKGTNALLYPRLGDYAVVKPTPTDKDPAAFAVVTAGLFDESWQLPKK